MTFNVLYWVFMIALQMMSPDEMAVHGNPVVFRIQGEQAEIVITRLKDPAEDYWHFTAELFEGNRLQERLDASGCFGEEGMLLFSMTDSNGKILFGVNDAAGPLLLKEYMAPKTFIYLTANSFDTYDALDDSEEMPSGNMIERKFSDGCITVTITYMDKSMYRILYALDIQTPREGYAIIRKEE